MLCRFKKYIYQLLARERIFFSYPARATELVKVRSKERKKEKLIWKQKDPLKTKWNSTVYIWLELPCTAPYLADVYKQHNTAFTRLQLHTVCLLCLQFGNVHSCKTCNWLRANYIKDGLNFKTPLLSSPHLVKGKKKWEYRNWVYVPIS